MYLVIPSVFPVLTQASIANPRENTTTILAICKTSKEQRSM